MTSKTSHFNSTFTQRRRSSLNLFGKISIDSSPTTEKISINSARKENVSSTSTGLSMRADGTFREATPFTTKRPNRKRNGMKKNKRKAPIVKSNILKRNSNISKNSKSMVNNVKQQEQEKVKPIIKPPIIKIIKATEDEISEGSSIASDSLSIFNESESSSSLSYSSSDNEEGTEGHHAHYPLGSNSHCLKTNHRHACCPVKDSLKNRAHQTRILEEVKAGLQHKNTQYVIVEILRDRRGHQVAYVVSWNCPGKTHSGPSFTRNLHVCMNGNKLKYNRSSKVTVSPFRAHALPLLKHNFKLASTQHDIAHCLKPGLDMGGKITRQIYFLKGAARFRSVVNHNLLHKIHAASAFKINPKGKKRYSI